MPDNNELENRLLRTTTYDQDAQSIQSGSESDEEAVLRRRSGSPDLRDYDEVVLQEDDERERLLAYEGPLNKVKNALRSSNPGKVSHRGSQVKEHRHRQSTSGPRRSLGRRPSQGQLMFEMEEGFKDNSSSSSSLSSLRIGEEKWAKDKNQQRRFQWLWWLMVPSLVVVLFFGLAYGAYRASSLYRHSQAIATLSNGSHVFAPTTILVSLDGFRADFLDRGLTPALNSFIASGVSPKFMLPSFPSVTFPNHFTLVTGLYPESHGIVGNTFWDPEFEEEFFYTDQAHSMQPKWWTAEPLWVTAEKSGVRTAIHMWPGSEAHIPPVEPTYLDKFNASEALPRRVDRILDLIDLPSPLDGARTRSSNPRPQLIAAYVPNVDADGHKYGPNSTEIRATISDVDNMLALLMDGLYIRNLTEIVNLVVVSDHGMASTSTERLVQLDDLIDLSLVDHIDGWPLRGLRLKDPKRDVPILHKLLLEASKKSQGFDVYTSETMPERYHFTQNQRIAPLWVIPRTGWAIVERKDFDVTEAQASGEKYHPMGIHGYDNEHPLMRAIFVARGPAFPHQPNSRVSNFQNIEVYNILCDSLGIQPHPNNGTLRLPLKTEGLHEDASATPKEGTPDPPNPAPPSDEIRPGHMERPNQGPPVRPGAVGEPPQQDDAQPPTDEQPEPSNEEPKAGKPASWWDSIHSHIQEVKQWAKDLLKKLEGKDKNG